MSKTTTKPKRTTRPSTRAAQPQVDPVAAAKAERRRLKDRIRLEKEVVRLAGQLEREIRKGDYRLMELGGALMARHARMQQVEAGRDLMRETSVIDRQPQVVE